MRTKLVPLLALCFVLLVSQVALAQFTGGSFDSYAMGTSSADISLPVQLSDFSATTFGDNTILKWRTATEIENLGFNIYRSDIKDGKYVKVNATLIKGAGTDATPHDYSFTDENVVKGVIYYYTIWM